MIDITTLHFSDLLWSCGLQCGKLVSLFGRNI